MSADNLARHFAAARDTANKGGEFREEGCGYVVADCVLAPWLDSIASDHARYVAELDAACRRAGL